MFEDAAIRIFAVKLDLRKTLTDANDSIFQPKPCELSRSDYKKGAQIWTGTFGTVFEGLLVPSNRKIAIKSLIKDRTSHTVDELIQKIIKIAQLKHENVIETYGYCRDRVFFEIVMELGSSSLRLFMSEFKPQLNTKQILRILVQIADGMNYLHSNEMVHRDLKQDNVVLNFNPVNLNDQFDLVKFKIIDLGSEIGTPIYMSPETMQTRCYTKMGDVYTFGVMAWELATGRIAFDGLSDFEIEIKIQRESCTPELPHDMNKDLKALLIDIWEHENNRPTFEQICKRLELVQPDD